MGALIGMLFMFIGFCVFYPIACVVYFKCIKHSNKTFKEMLEDF